MLSWLKHATSPAQDPNRWVHFGVRWAALVLGAGAVAAVFTRVVTPDTRVQHTTSLATGGVGRHINR